VTLGAITLLSSTDLMQRYRQAHGLAGTAMKGHQSHVAWWEDVNDPMRQLGGAEPPNMSGEEFQEALGDAQWYGAQETLTTLAAERAAASRGDITWSVEQFREPEIDPAKSAITAVPVAQLMSALQAYPNGTQFCLWLYAPPPDRMQHYVYAEKFSGRLVVEDYQPNKADRRKPPPHQHTYVDAMPNKSLGSLAPNYFTHGCFWALKPQFVKHEREQQMADREMRRLIRRGLPAH
jgi:hypothetical protein